MTIHRGSFYFVIGLIVFVPTLTLVATGYRMVVDGGGGWIRPTEVHVAAGAATPPAPVTPAASATPTAGQPPAVAGGTAGGTASAPVANAAPRSATDFSASNAAWEATLKNADAKAGAQLASAGRPAQGVQACVACHGQQGVAPAGGAFPNLAGLRPEYIAKQLVDYAQGQRANAIMVPIAKGLQDNDIGALAAYYGGLPVPPVVAPTNPNEVAAKLDIQGDNARALPACANCHGMTGRGEGPLLPRLAGQPKGYFIEQMNEFRSGQRHNDDVGVMQAFSKRLTPEDIEALGDYYARAGAQPQP